MKLIRILHMIGSLNIGGSQAMVMNLYRNIDRNKIQFDFIIDHPDERHFADEVKALGGKIYVMPGVKMTNIRQIRKAWDTFFKEHTEYKILHSHVRSYASIYLPIAKKNQVFTVIHSHSTANGKGIEAIIKSVLQYPLRYQADYYMACSDKAGRWLFGKRILLSDKYKMFPNAIDGKRYVYNEQIRNNLRKKLGLKDEFVIGHVGRMTGAKNHVFLLDVFFEYHKQNNNSRLLLVGDGEEKSKIEEKCRKYHIEDSVIMVGNQSNVCDYYQAMDFFVFPSVWEGLGMVLIEAQASGLCCVASDTIPKETNIGSGKIMYLSLLESAKKWAETISDVQISDRTDQLKYVKKSGYDITDNAKKMEEFYLNIFK